MLCWRGSRDLAASGPGLHMEVISSWAFPVFFPVLSLIHLWGEMCLKHNPDNTSRSSSPLFASFRGHLCYSVSHLCSRKKRPHWFSQRLHEIVEISPYAGHVHKLKSFFVKKTVTSRKQAYPEQEQSVLRITLVPVFHAWFRSGIAKWNHSPFYPFMDWYYQLLHIFAFWY